MRQLAAGSVGQARSAMQLAAAQTANDYELQRGGIANHGTVEAVAPLRGSGDRYVVVTRETTTAALSSAYQGLRPAWHVAVATVSALGPGRWVVSGWQPES
jgi:sarcosine oxidase gamma subunit